MKLTQHFSLSEFATHDGTPVPPEYIPKVQALANVLQVIRDAIGEPLIIVSGYRHPAYNVKVGGAPKSTHLTARGADIACKTLSPRKLLAVVKRLQADGAIPKVWTKAYLGWLHVDVRFTVPA